MTLPIFLLNILSQQLPRLAAEELLADILAASAPHMEKRARRDLIWRIERAVKANGRLEAGRPQGIAPTKQDPEAARKWFEERGIKAL